MHKTHGRTIGSNGEGQ